MADVRRSGVDQAMHDLATFELLNAEAMRLIARTNDDAAIREVVRVVTSAVRSIPSSRS